MAGTTAKTRRRSARSAADPTGLFSAIEGLQRLAEVFDLRRQQLAREAGLTDAQWRVLEEIAREDFMPSLFARRRECTAAAISRTLRQLQDLGLIAVSISTGDARQRDYRLTAAGKRTLGKLRQSREQALDAVWSDLPAAEIERFGRFSADLADRLEAYAAGRSEG